MGGCWLDGWGVDVSGVEGGGGRDGALGVRGGNVEVGGGWEGWGAEVGSVGRGRGRSVCVCGLGWTVVALWGWNCGERFGWVGSRSDGER